MKLILWITGAGGQLSGPSGNWCSEWLLCVWECHLNLRMSILNPNNRRFTGIESDTSLAIDFIGIREPQTSHKVAIRSGFCLLFSSLKNGVSILRKK